MSGKNYFLLLFSFFIFSSQFSFAQAIPPQMMDNHGFIPDSAAIRKSLDSTFRQADSLKTDTAGAQRNAAAPQKAAPLNPDSNKLGTDTIGKVEVGSISDSIQKQLRGTVYETDGKTPVFGAAVGWIHHKSTVQTDTAGRFLLPYFTNDSLVISSVGYSEKRIKVSDGINDLKIMLGVNSQTKLQEVVVTAMGIERDTRSLSYDVQQIEGSAVNTVPTSSGNVMSALTGKVPGLVTTQAAGGPGSAVSVILRGHRSLQGSNNALLVVDGVPVDNSFGSQPSDESGGYAGSDGAVNINPGDIASISILKGQSAAALYGGQAANGAIMITTKSGYDGKMKISYNGGISLKQPMLLMNYQNEYGRGNGGVYGEHSGMSWGKRSQTYPDNVKDFFHNAAIINNSISIAGGSKTLQGYASYTNNAATGIVGKNELMAHTLNLRLTGHFADKLTTGLKITYVDQQINNKVNTGEIGTVINAYIIPRDMGPDEFRHYEDFDEYGQPYPAPWPTTNASIYTNPYWHINRTSYDTKRNRAIILGSAKYDFTNWLNLQVRYSMDFYTDRATGKFYDKSVLLAPNPGGRYYELMNQRSNQYFDILLSGKNYFLKHLSLSYNAGASFKDIKASSVNTYANGLHIANLFTLANALSTSVSNGNSWINTQGIFATAQLGFKEYLYLDATARNDWSSTLPAPYDFFYPSVGLTAVLSDALHLPSWVTFGKVRGTYAFVGNDARPFIIHQYYSYGAGTGNGFISRDATQAIKDLKPEQTRSFEVGTDWSFFDSRINAHITLYTTNTYNQLLSLPLPPASGFSSRWVNAGDIRNQGIEVQLSGVPVRKNDFSWTTTFNFSKNNNKVISLLPDLKKAKISGSERLAVIGVNEGESYGAIYGQAWKKNAQGQYIVDANGLPVIEQDQKIGNFNPDFLVGWSNHFRYKNFTLDFQLDGRVGGNVVSGTDAYLAYYGLAGYTTKFRDGGLVLPGVHEDGTPNTTGISAENFWTTVSQAGRAAWTEFFTYDATNFRLRSFSLGYVFNIDKPYLKSAQLSIVGSNLFFLYRGNAILKIPGMPERKIPTDPEMSLGAGNSQGIESGMPPSTRTIGLNLKLNF